ncbi:GNAT family N-acetyltransferase [Clostridium sp.]|uniref:GNAT family N-acetyltransferase n=1 Tax=Clostridium sp. TaxID=1506 RepID=UPI003464D7DC
MEIVTDRLCLREITEKDYDFFFELETNESCLKYESDTIKLKEAIDKKFSEAIDEINKIPRVVYRFIISDLYSNESIGRVILWKIDDSINEWEIGWDVHPNYWGNGYAPEAARELLKFAFNNLKIHRVQALCNDQNINSEKVMIKIGMIKEGTCRGVRFLNNCWYGSHIYSLLEDEFNN